MKSNHKWLRNASHCCAEIGPDDGIDPRVMSKQVRLKDRNKPKNLQLCKAAERTIHLVFAGECGDPTLEALNVRKVELSSDGRAFVVSVAMPGEVNPRTIESTAASLGRMKGTIRTLIAQIVRRKRVPALRFRVSSAEAPSFYEKEA